MPLLIPSLYRHTQSEASTTWVIEHNLQWNGSDGTAIIDVLVDDGSGNTVKIMPDTVEKTSAGTVTLIFTSARSGEAVIIV